MLWRSLGLLLAIPCVSGAQSTQNWPEPGTIVEASREPGVSVYERRLLRLLEQQRALEALAFSAATPPTDPDILRQIEVLSKEYQLLIADNPDQVDPLILFGKFLAAFGDREGAHVQFSKAYRLNRDLPVVNHQLGTYLAEEGKPEEALPFYLRAAELAPREAFYHYQLGELIRAFLPELEKAGFSRATLQGQMLNAFAFAAKVEPDNVDLQMRYGEAFYDVDAPDWQRALDHWQDLQDRADLPEVIEEAVRLHEARVLLNLGRRDDAHDLADEPVETPALEATRQHLLDLLEKQPSASSSTPPP